MLDSFHFVVGLLSCSFVGVLLGILVRNSGLLFYGLYCLALTWGGDISHLNEWKMLCVFSVWEILKTFIGYLLNGW